MRALLACCLVAVLVSACASGGRLAGRRALVRMPVESPDNRSEVADLRAKVQQQDRELLRLREQLAEAGDAEALRAEIKRLKAEVADAQQPDDVIEPGSPDFAEAVKKAIEEKAEADRRERDEDRKKRMQQLFEQQIAKTISALDEKLSLTEAQESSIRDHLKRYGTARIETMGRGSAAREKGEEFDFQGEFTKLRDKYTKAVRDELTADQQADFDDLVGDKGIDFQPRG